MLEFCPREQNSDCCHALLKTEKKKNLPSQIHFTVLADYLTMPFMQNLEIVKVWDQILFSAAEI